MEKLAPGTANYLISEANGTRSREVVTVAKGHQLQAGAVLAVIEASGQFVPVDPAATDGSQTPVAVLFAEVDTTEAERAAVTTARDAEVAAHALAWPAGMTEPQKTTALAQLAARGIVAR
jgi:hypothetical protein